MPEKLKYGINISAGQAVLELVIKKVKHANVVLIKNSFGRPKFSWHFWLPPTICFRLLILFFLKNPCWQFWDRVQFSLKWLLIQFIPMLTIDYMTTKCSYRHQYLEPNIQYIIYKRKHKIFVTIRATFLVFSHQYSCRKPNCFLLFCFQWIK